MYPIERKCETCKAEPGVWCTLTRGGKAPVLHASRLKPTTESSTRDAEHYRRGGDRGARSSMRRKT
jgi:hypothetical protein